MSNKPIIKQVPMKSEEAKNFFYEKDFFGIYMYDWLLMGAPKNIIGKAVSLFSNTPSFVLMGAALHVELNKVVTKQNTMIEGKYKKARLYLFETPSVYIAATCETGDRGSGWYVLKKSDLNNVRKMHYTDEILKFDKTNLKELSQFMRSICWNVIEHNIEYKKEYTEENKRYQSFLQSLQEEFGKFSKIEENQKMKLK